MIVLIFREVIEKANQLSAFDCSLTRMLCWDRTSRWNHIGHRPSFSVRPWLQVIPALMVAFPCPVALQKRFSLLWLVERRIFYIPPIYCLSNSWNISSLRMLISLIFQDFTMQPPARELVARDLHDNMWTFRHIYRGKSHFYASSVSFTSTVSHDVLNSDGFFRTT